MCKNQYIEIFLTYILCKLEFVPDFAFSRVLDKLSFTVAMSEGKKDQSVLFVCCNIFFAKALFPFLFKWSLLLPKWNPLKYHCYQ